MKCKISRLTILGVCLAEAWPEPYQEQEQKQQPLHRHCAAPSRIGSAQISVTRSQPTPMAVLGEAYARTS